MSINANEKTPAILAAAAEASAPATTGHAPPPGYQQQPYSYAPPPGYQQPYSYAPPPGYQQQPYSYAPSPGYQQQPYSYAPPQRSTNGWAIASLVLGILGFALFLFVLSAVFGFIALSQTKDGRQSGRGMAITGLVLSGIWFLLYFAAFLSGFVQGASGQ
jgi:hypothetical protein